MKTINKYYQELKNKAKQKTRPPPRLKLPTRGKEGPRVQTGPPPTPGPLVAGEETHPARLPAGAPPPQPLRGQPGSGDSFPGHTAQDTRRAGRKAPGTQVLTPGREVEQSRRGPAWWRPSPFVSCTHECAHPPQTHTNSAHDTHVHVHGCPSHVRMHHTHRAPTAVRAHTRRHHVLAHLCTHTRGHLSSHTCARVHAQLVALTPGHRGHWPGLCTTAGTLCDSRAHTRTQ